MSIPIRREFLRGSRAASTAQGDSAVVSDTRATDMSCSSKAPRRTSAPPSASSSMAHRFLESPVGPLGRSSGSDHHFHPAMSAPVAQQEQRPQRNAGRRRLRREATTPTIVPPKTPSSLFAASHGGVPGAYASSTSSGITAAAAPVQSAAASTLSGHLQLSEGLSSADYLPAFRALAVGSTRQLHIVEVVPAVARDVKAVRDWEGYQQQQQQQEELGHENKAASGTSAPPLLTASSPFVLRNAGVFGGLVKVENVLWYPSTEEASLVFVQPSRTVTIFLDALMFKADGSYASQQWTRSQGRGKTLNSAVAAGSGFTSAAVVTATSWTSAAQTVSSSTGGMSHATGGATTPGNEPQTPASRLSQTATAPLTGQYVTREKGPLARELIELNIDITYARLERIAWDPHNAYTLALTSVATHFELWQVPTDGTRVYAPQMMLRPPAHGTRGTARDVAFSPSDPNLILVVVELTSAGQILLYDRRRVESPRYIDLAGPCLAAAFHPLFPDLLAICYRREKIKSDCRITFFRVTDENDAKASANSSSASKNNNGFTTLTAVRPMSTGESGETVSVQPSDGYREGYGSEEPRSVSTTAVTTPASQDILLKPSAPMKISGGPLPLEAGVSGERTRRLETYPNLVEQTMLPPIDYYGAVNRLRWRPPTCGFLAPSAEGSALPYVAFVHSADGLNTALEDGGARVTPNPPFPLSNTPNAYCGGSRAIQSDVLASQLWFATTSMAPDNDVCIWDAANGYFPVCAIKFFTKGNHEPNDMVWINETSLVTVFKGKDIVVASLIHSDGIIDTAADKRSCRGGGSKSRAKSREDSVKEKAEMGGRENREEYKDEYSVEEDACLAASLYKADSSSAASAMVSLHAVLPAAAVEVDLFGRSFLVRNSAAAIKEHYIRLIRLSVATYIKRALRQQEMESALKEEWCALRSGGAGGGTKPQQTQVQQQQQQQQQQQLLSASMNSVSSGGGAGSGHGSVSGGTAGSTQGGSGTCGVQLRSRLGILQRSRDSSSRDSSVVGTTRGVPRTCNACSTPSTPVTVVPHHDSGDGIAWVAPAAPASLGMGGHGSATLLQNNEGFVSVTQPLQIAGDELAGAGATLREGSESPYPQHPFHQPAPLQVERFGSKSIIARMLGFGRKKHRQSSAWRVSRSPMRSAANLPETTVAGQVQGQYEVPGTLSEPQPQQNHHQQRRHSDEIAVHVQPNFSLRMSTTATLTGRSATSVQPGLYRVPSSASVVSQVPSTASYPNVHGVGASVAPPNSSGVTRYGVSSDQRFLQATLAVVEAPSGGMRQRDRCPVKFFSFLAQQAGARRNDVMPQRTFSLQGLSAVQHEGASAQGNNAIKAATTTTHMVSASSAAASLPCSLPATLSSQLAHAGKPHHSATGPTSVKLHPAVLGARSLSVNTPRLARAWDAQSVTHSALALSSYDGPSLLSSALYDRGGARSHSAIYSHHGKNNNIAPPASTLVHAQRKTSSPTTAVSPSSPAAATLSAIAFGGARALARVHPIIESFVLSDGVCGWSYRERRAEEAMFVRYALEWEMGYELALSMKRLRHSRDDDAADRAKMERAGSSGEIGVPVAVSGTSSTTIRRCDSMIASTSIAIGLPQALHSPKAAGEFGSTLLSSPSQGMDVIDVEQMRKELLMERQRYVDDLFADMMESNAAICEKQEKQPKELLQREQQTSSFFPTAGSGGIDEAYDGDGASGGGRTSATAAAHTASTAAAAAAAAANARAAVNPRTHWWRSAAHAWRTHEPRVITAVAVGQLEYGSLLGDVQYCLVLYVLYCLWWRHRYPSQSNGADGEGADKDENSTLNVTTAETEGAGGDPLDGASAATSPTRDFNPQECPLLPDPKSGSTTASATWGSSENTGSHARECTPHEWKQRALQWLDAYTADLYARKLYVPLNELLLIIPEILQEPTNPIQPRASDVAYKKQMTYVHCGSGGCENAELVARISTPGNSTRGKTASSTGSGTVAAMGLLLQLKDVFGGSRTLSSASSSHRLMPHYMGRLRAMLSVYRASTASHHRQRSKRRQQQQHHQQQQQQMVRMLRMLLMTQQGRSRKGTTAAAAATASSLLAPEEEALVAMALVEHQQLLHRKKHARMSTHQSRISISAATNAAGFLSRQEMSCGADTVSVSTMEGDGGAGAAGYGGESEDGFGHFGSSSSSGSSVSIGRSGDSSTNSNSGSKSGSCSSCSSDDDDEDDDAYYYDDDDDATESGEIDDDNSISINRSSGGGEHGNSFASSSGGTLTYNSRHRRHNNNHNSSNNHRRHGHLRKHRSFSQKQDRPCAQQSGASVSPRSRRVARTEAQSTIGSRLEPAILEDPDPLPQNAVCSTCANAMAMQCAICETVVEGMYYWTRSCGHGGHVDHMEEWFRISNECPKCGVPITEVLRLHT